MLTGESSNFAGLVLWNYIQLKTRVCAAVHTCTPELLNRDTDGSKVVSPVRVIDVWVWGLSLTGDWESIRRLNVLHTNFSVTFLKK